MKRMIAYLKIARNFLYCRHVVFLTGAFVVLFIWNSVLSLTRSPLQVVTYNPTHTIHEFSKNAAAHHLSPEKLKALSQRFSRVLEETLKTYASTHHVVILKPQDVMVAQGDITTDIEQLVSQNMKEEK